MRANREVVDAPFYDFGAETQEFQLLTRMNKIFNLKGQNFKSCSNSSVMWFFYSNPSLAAVVN